MSLSQAIESLLGSTPAHGVPESLRARHAQAFLDAGLPTPRQENWKYTPLRVLEKTEYDTGEPGESAFSAEDLAGLDLLIDRAWRVVLVDGRWRPSLSFLDGLPEGCRIRSLADGIESGSWADGQLERPFDEPDQALSALNGALATDGVVIEVAPGVNLDRPLHLLTLDGAGESARLVHRRHLVHLGEGASLHLVEEYRNDAGSAAFGNDVLQVVLAEGASLDHLRVQQLGDEGALVTRSLVEQHSGSRYGYHGFDFGGRLVRHDLQVDLAGPGAECRLHGVYLLDDGHHVDNHVRIDHRSPGAASHEVFKGVLGGKSRGVFNGKVVVHPGADGTDATQSNGNLLLSRQAEADTKPELEIYADDVKCSHGATVGQLDEAQLFYLRSRGLPVNEARELLTEAFCREVVDTLDDESLRDVLGKRLKRHMPHAPATETHDVQR